MQQQTTCESSMHSLSDAAAENFASGYDPALTEVRVDCRDGKFVIFDMGSGHGTLVNGYKVSHAVIHS